MRKALTLTLSILTVLLLVSSAPHASADENPIVEIWYQGAKTDYIPVPPPVTVEIKAYSAVGPYDVKVVKPDSSIDTLGTNVPSGVWFMATYICYLTGWYEVKAGPVSGRWGVGTFFVIPELPLGTVVAMVASFGALAGLGTTRRLRLRL